MNTERSCKLIELYQKGVISSISLKNTILKVIGKIPTRSWWGQMLLASDDNKQKAYAILYGKREFKQSEIKEKILTIQSSYKSLITITPGFNNFQEEAIEELKKEILPPDSGLRRFLNGRSKERPSMIEFWHFTCFSIWHTFRFNMFVDYGKVLNANGVEYDYNTLLNDLEGLHHIVRSFGACYDADDFDQVIDIDYHIKSQDFKSLVNGNETDETKISNMVDFWKRTYDSVVNKDCATELYNFFYILNTCFIDEYTKQEIVEILRRQKFNSKIAKLYDMFMDDHPDYADNYSFVPGFPKLEKKDIDWGGNRDLTCFNLPISSKKIEYLYEKLVKNKYMSKDMDIVVFAHLMTGLPYVKSRPSMPINWIHKERQSLAVFIGEIKRHGFATHLTWGKAYKIFRFHGEQFKTDRSSPYFQANKNKKEYKELSQLIEFTLGVKSLSAVKK